MTPSAESLEFTTHNSKTGSSWVSLFITMSLSHFWDAKFLQKLVWFIVATPSWLSTISLCNSYPKYLRKLLNEYIIMVTPQAKMTKYKLCLKVMLLGILQSFPKWVAPNKSSFLLFCSVLIRSWILTNLQMFCLKWATSWDKISSPPKLTPWSTGRSDEFAKLAWLMWERKPFVKFPGVVSRNVSGRS